MSDWMNAKLVHQYQHERLREAAHIELMRNASAASQSKPIYAPTLAMIGGWLVAWGTRLQRLHGNVISNFVTAGDDACSCGDNFLAELH